MLPSGVAGFDIEEDAGRGLVGGAGFGGYEFDGGRFVDFQPDLGAFGHGAGGVGDFGGDEVRVGGGLDPGVGPGGAGSGAAGRGGEAGDAVAVAEELDLFHLVGRRFTVAASGALLPAAMT